MPGATVEQMRVPEGTLAAGLLGRVDYADAFRVRWPGAPSVDEVARSFATSAPDWVMALMRLRDRLVSLLRLKTSPAMTENAPGGPKRLEMGERVGIFRVLGCSADELVLGEDDRHLDFRVGVRLDADGASAGPWVSLCTLVHFHNRLGRLYFAVVGPFHRRIVPAMLRAMVSKGSRP